MTISYTPILDRGRGLWGLVGRYLSLSLAGSNDERHWNFNHCIYLIQCGIHKTYLKKRFHFCLVSLPGVAIRQKVLHQLAQDLVDELYQITITQSRRLGA